MLYKFTPQSLFVLVLSAILAWPMGPVLSFEPVVVTITNPANGASFQIGENINFSAATVGGTAPYSFVWDFGDGATLAGPTVAKLYNAGGAKTVTVISSDFEGVQARASIGLNIQTVVPPSALVVTIDRPADNATFPVGQDIDFSVSASGGTLPYSFVWDFGDGATLAGPAVTKSYNATGTKVVIVRGTDFAGAVSSSSITLTISETAPPSSEPLTISNIRVTDVTHESAIIRWTTNRPATSRVIYDTVSHSSITGQSAPNFGYAFSTAILDPDPKVAEHAVTVSSLSPNTTYYFRVISQ
ncbi:MAG: PKD domain-containing protein [Candidatus Vogelbacteria bacterium]|nr:PKD domain-containing protein [Candidatus Vogelbacteria bacterium]